MTRTIPEYVALAHALLDAGAVRGNPPALAAWRDLLTDMAHAGVLERVMGKAAQARLRRLRGEGEA